MEKTKKRKMDENASEPKKRKQCSCNGSCSAAVDCKKFMEDPYYPHRPYRITIAVAGTVLDNAVGPMRKAVLAGQIARAVSIFNVDDVVIFNDKGKPTESEGCKLLDLLLRYVECPPYMKKQLFPLESDLQSAGLIPPLCLPNHYTRDAVVPYREGVTTKQGLVDVGLLKKADCGLDLPEGIRVTVKLLNPKAGGKGPLKGEIVSPTEPTTVDATYWGYKVTTANSIAEILKDPKYDCIVGTSDRGDYVSAMETINGGIPFENLLLVFGGVDGLESAVSFENDTEASYRRRFRHYINARPYQGTKTIRTEEAIPLTLSALVPVLRNTVMKFKAKTK